MLSEPRRKRQRITDDPNNLRWARDKEKLGQKLLEKMGWRAGTGLGAQEQGRTDPLAIRANAGFRGLGSDRTTDIDVHTEHRRNFDSLLASLKDNCTDFAKQNDEHESGSNSQPTCSLVTLSKSSRRRIHYSKFAKAKELSTASAVDLATVTGDLEKHTTSELAELEEERRKVIVSNPEASEYNAGREKSETCRKNFLRQPFVKSGAN